MNLHQNQNVYRSFTTSEFNRLCGITVNYVGLRYVKPTEQYSVIDQTSTYTYYPQKCRKTDVYQLIYLTKGKGELTIKGRNKITIEPGNVIFLKPNEWHNYKTDSTESWCEYSIGFQGFAIENMLNNNFFSKNKNVFNVGLNKELILLYENSIEMANFKKENFQHILTGNVMHIIGLILYESQNS